ncbi:Retrovirus-related Pol polyprotein from transposon opus [Labeo rohita]|uniref:Gypsy retrotransposon integrase-like protein 1 n=1 Tax=Labeo rohita TaxID=84645 RepID=A0ABQ8MVP7_LABRO|nr:Retrovirus-related Pol polyprotein from transposon opus [Labeo rohita]
MLKEKLLNCVVLAHPDFSKPLILSIDASLDGLGTVLSQVPAGEEIVRPIAFASKTLNASQKKYPAHRLEFLALKWSVCEKFSHWLKGHTVCTDNNPLTYIMSKPKLDACEQRWVSKLAPYSFDIKHIAGTKNAVADTLSRDPFASTVSHRLMNESYNHLLTEADAVKEEGIQDVFRLKVECHKLNDRVGCHRFNRLQLLHLLGFSHDELQRSQELDVTISKVLPFVIRKRRPSRQERGKFDFRAQALIKQWDHLKVQDWVLYRVTKDPVSKQKRHQYVLPRSLLEKALAGLHDLAGHQGQARTIHLARQRFFWPKMEYEIKEYVKCCRRDSLSESIRIKAQIFGVSLFLNCWHLLGSPNLARLPIILWATPSQSGFMRQPAMPPSNSCLGESHDYPWTSRPCPKHAVQEQNEQTKMYNRKIKGVHLNCGDRVLIANKGERGNWKLADRWESTVYTIVDRDPKTHIYRVKDDKGLTKVLHQNILLDISFLPVTLPEDKSCGSMADECSDDSDHNKKRMTVVTLTVVIPSQTVKARFLSDEAMGPGISDADSASAEPDMTNPDADDSVSEDVSIPGHEQGKFTARAGRVVKRPLGDIFHQVAHKTLYVSED